MGYAQDQLKKQLAINRRNKDFGSFDANNITDTQLNKLRNDVYGGYKTRATPKYETRGAGRDGMRKVQTGYDQTFDADYYKSHPGWSKIGDKLGININSQNDVRQLYDSVSGYQPPAAAASPAPDAPAPLMPTISDESKKYRAETEALLSQIDKKLTDFNATEAAATKAKEIAEQTRVRNFAIQSANQARSNQTANLQIQPASSTPKTAGTQAFKKRRIASNRKQQLTSGINLGTSSLLNI